MLLKTGSNLNGQGNYPLPVFMAGIIRGDIFVVVPFLCNVANSAFPKVADGVRPFVAQSLLISPRMTISMQPETL